ncbi:protein kinase family protein [Alkaliphilus hydrothermalis]|uniref:Aminoglycoside phosphotransferase domain-containing protein n=1 Tax=Alkaliphilus hydrothermalis TaxID=1482730 RepID=A0ABS2NTR2_9FIRM|nr:hypothetical protein [Alkaliphilus hydrothermalis]MBM7616369.1 hypothetical protein [Alkaliphilus hydrothermalis]
MEELLDQYNKYLHAIEPIAFLDDLTTKNVLIHEGKLSAIIDIDCICFGDKIYFIALTNMALISLGYDTKYIDYLVKEMKLSEYEKEILKLYTLVFCVDFMGEKGLKIKDKVIPATQNEIIQLNDFYEKIFNELTMKL